MAAAAERIRRGRRRRKGRQRRRWWPYFAPISAKQSHACNMRHRFSTQRIITLWLGLMIENRKICNFLLIIASITEVALKKARDEIV